MEQKSKQTVKITNILLKKAEFGFKWLLLGPLSCRSQRNALHNVQNDNSAEVFYWEESEFLAVPRNRGSIDPMIPRNWNDLTTIGRVWLGKTGWTWCGGEMNSTISVLNCRWEFLSFQITGKDKKGVFLNDVTYCVPNTKLRS